MSRLIDKIVVHVTDTPDGRPVTVAEINAWHKAKGWNGIGYHYVVHQDGKIDKGRPETVVGAHVEGHNHDSIGIVWVGRNKISTAQRAALVTKVLELMKKYKLDTSHVFGHSELNSGKTCPNLDMNQFRKDLK